MAIIVAAALMPRIVQAQPHGSTAELVAEYEGLEAQYRTDMEHMAHVAYSRQWSQLGDLARLWRPEPPASGLVLFVAPDQYGGDLQQVSLPEPTPATEPWLDQFDELRRQQADAIFALAKRAADAGQRSLAFTWATEAVRENPDHADARRVLGYEQRDGVWLTHYGLRMAEAGQTWHPKFGWVAAGDIPRYEAGERLVGGQWITAEADASRHSRLEDGWQVRTDHFMVTTNHSLQAAAELAGQLERLYQVWRQLFAGFYLSEREVQQLLAGAREARKQTRPFRVFYHRDRDEYVAALARRQPRIAETVGIYFDVDREAHFFADASEDFSILYHEAVHQLFYEARPVSRHIGQSANFWIIEGIATYFETLREHEEPGIGRYYTIGEASVGRLPSARTRMTEGGYYFPLAKFVRLDKLDLQRRPDIAKLYSQAAGLAAFLMDADGGRYREPLVHYLVSVYAGRDDPRTLARATGRTYRQLDAEYRRFLESLP